MAREQMMHPETVRRQKEIERRGIGVCLRQPPPGPADRGRGGQRTPRRRADHAVALVRRLRAGHHRMVVAPDRSDRGPPWGAGHALSRRRAVDRRRAAGRARRGGQPRAAQLRQGGTRAAPPPTSWPAGASPCWFTTRSPGAAAGSICPSPRHDWATLARTLPGGGARTDSQPG